MAYEVEAITPITTPIDATAAKTAVMREERVLEPYQRKVTAVAPTEIGQKTINDTSTQAAPEAPKPTVETVALSPQMAALARKEQAIRRQEKDFKAKEAALVAREAEVARLKAMEQKIAAKDYSEVEKVVPYNEYAQWLIDKGTETTPEQQALKKLESEVQGMKDAQKTDLEKRFEAAVADRKRAVTELVGSSQEFPGIKKLKQEDAVVQHILDTWEHDSVELTVEQAAKEVELAMKAEAKAWAAILETETVTPPVEEKKPLPPIRQGTKTLTNDMTIQGEAKPIRKSLSGLTDAERWAEARRRAEVSLKARG